MKNRILNSTQTALVVIDIQEAFRGSIKSLDAVITRASIAVEAFKILDLPMVVTEQYPSGLGHTVEELNLDGGKVSVFEKSRFSACGKQDFDDHLKQLETRDVLIAGIETHVCVNQTVHGLLDSGFNVHILEDAVASRKSSDHTAALKKMYSSGAVPATVEMALFELLVDSRSNNFKQIQSLIK